MTVMACLYAQGLPGIFLRKNVIETAQAALADNIARLGPLLTPPGVKVGAPRPRGCVQYNTYRGWV